MPNPILNRGGAGISISRPETVDRLRPLIRQFNELHLLYVSALPRLPAGEGRERVEGLLRIARMDIDKIEETIHSSGGVSYTLTDIGEMKLAGSGQDDGVLEQLLAAERAFLAAIQGESKTKHHIRTQAILMNVESNSRARLGMLEDTVRKTGTSE